MLCLEQKIQLNAVLESSILRKVFKESLKSNAFENNASKLVLKQFKNNTCKLILEMMLRNMLKEHHYNK